MWKSGVVIAAVAGLFSGSAYAQCVSVKGKIVNNINTPVAFQTMGVANIAFDNGIKLKCAVHGTPQVPPPGSNVAFIHTLSCEDETSDPNIPGPGPVHSKLQFNTVGTVNLDTQPISFTETSTPVPGTGTGQLSWVQGGSITITGQIYPTGAIDMKFTGQGCSTPN